MTGEEVLTVAEAAQRLRVSAYTVRSLLRSGHLRGYRPGGTKTGWRVRAAEVQRFIADAEAQAAERKEPQP
jgi:excisionase family DNA binding protein